MADKSEVQPPTRVARKFVRYAVGFGVGVGIGMIPLQRQLLVLIPAQIHSSLVPIAAFAMGVVAVVVQYFYDDRIGRKRQKRRFLTCLVLLVISLVSLLYLHVNRIRILPVPGFETSISVIIGPERLERCGCSDDRTDLECIEDVSLRRVDTCWDTDGTKFAFFLSYLLLMCTFGALIGFLMVWENTRSRQKAMARQG